LKDKKKSRKHSKRKIKKPSDKDSSKQREPLDDKPSTSRGILDSDRQPLPLVTEVDPKHEGSSRKIISLEPRTKKMGRATLEIHNKIKEVHEDQTLPVINILSFNSNKNIVTDSKKHIQKELSKADIELQNSLKDKGSNSKKSSDSPDGKFTFSKQAVGKEKDVPKHFTFN
jgi:hypothetical protein